MLRPSQKTLYIASNKSQIMEEFSQSLGESTSKKTGCLQQCQTEASKTTQAVLKQTLALTFKYQE